LINCRKPFIYYFSAVTFFISSPTVLQGEADGVTEFEIWQGLANLYSSLSHRDAEICLQKARALKSYSAATLQAEGETNS
jgi:hypothetical protein